MKSQQSCLPLNKWLKNIDLYSYTFECGHLKFIMLYKDRFKVYVVASSFDLCQNVCRAQFFKTNDIVS